MSIKICQGPIDDPQWTQDRKNYTYPSAPPPTHGIHLSHLAPSAVASSWTNILTSVVHDLSDLQDADVPEESVDDTYSKRRMPPAANWVRAQGPKEPLLHAKPFKLALKKSGAFRLASNSPSNHPKPTVNTPTQD
ncbi:hypothetical protein DAPPUDRAFT_262137 [Daphnia pulex]|uniref:Uncharacterized protein n=1 Tax=Daphnia pulex TaxID=6669 RepID=E9HMF6_DAPPU|nr:hypothetical protein DAPPUDRAFT_262137 [Daphnia pulex]|eukprot:EFX67083.1 hypothetical protein DAPPUDRAFT_262137 [Daphnia pulex]